MTTSDATQRQSDIRKLEDYVGKRVIIINNKFRPLEATLREITPHLLLLTDCFYYFFSGGIGSNPGIDDLKRGFLGSNKEYKIEKSGYWMEDIILNLDSINSISTYENI